MSIVDEEGAIAPAPGPETVAGGEGGPAAAGGAQPPEIEALRAELASLRDRHLRLQAEFDNCRKRHQRERESIHRQAKERLLREIPGVLDNLERALRHSQAPEAAPESLVQGVELVARQLEEILAGFGAKPMSVLGTAFDPHLHEAMAQVETSGEPPDGTVVEEFRRGWLLDGKVLRPALVAVAKSAGEAGDAAS